MKVESNGHERRDATPMDPQLVERRSAQVDRRASYVTDVAANVEAAVKTLDAHIDSQMKSVVTIALQTSLDMVAASDRLSNTVATKLREIDAVVQVSRRQVVAVLATCFLLLAAQAFEIYFETVRLGAWRQTGRNLQLVNGDKLDEVLARVRAHDFVFTPKR